MPEEPQEIAISVNGISKYFAPSAGQRSIKQIFANMFRKKDEKKDGYWALKDINFEIKKGEFFGIVGRNGSGKSTLLKMIAGVYTPTSGAIKVNGKLVPFIELGVGFNPELTGRDNVFLNGALLGFTRKEMESMYDEIVEFAELKDHMNVKLKNFSSGMQVRLAFSIAIRAKSDILLIDEVLAVGDAAFQQKCVDYFEKLKSSKQTVVFVTHDMGSVNRFCDKALYLENGKIIRSGKPNSIANLYKLKNMRSTQVDSHRVNRKDGLQIKILSQDKDHLVFEVCSKKHYNTETYIGISLMHEGRTIGELNSLGVHRTKINLRFAYKLDLKVLNPGSYEIDATLFSKDNREIVEMSPSRASFLIEGSDFNRGAALKLKNNWID